MEYQSELPYPSLDGIGEDYHTLRIVSPAYAGREGELKAILQYVYQSVLFGERGMKETATALIRIAVCEMHHLEILAKLICKLGAPPVFTACPPYPVSYYSSQSVCYVREPLQMIRADICAEENAINCYSNMLRRIDNPPVVEVIARIIEDEKIHLTDFQTILQQLSC